LLPELSAPGFSSAQARRHFSCTFHYTFKRSREGNDRPVIVASILKIPAASLPSEIFRFTTTIFRNNLPA
jgi:hypothetical protein